MTAARQQTTRRAVIWSALDVFLRQGVQFIVLVLLARLLAPEDFGLVAMLALFIGVAGIFIDGGLGSALIQRQHSSRSDESTIFYFNLGMGALTAALLCLGASWIATFFGHPLLESMTYALAFSLVLNALGAIHTSLLTREMDFRTLAKVGATSSLLSGALAVALAFAGYEVWSLVSQTLCASAVSALLLWWWHPWRPAWTFSCASLASYFRFGGYEMAANLTDAVSTNLNAILIGKLFSVREAGYYDRAQRMQQLPVNMMANIINRVAFSSFSRHSEDKARLAEGLKRSQQLSMVINLPAMAVLVVLAEPLVVTLLGARWAPAVPILQVLAVAGLLWPLHVMNLSVLKAQGKARVFFWITILKKTVAIGLTLAASLIGVMAIAWAQVAVSLFAFLVNAHYSRVLLGYGAFAQLRDLGALFAATVPMTLAMLALTAWLEIAPALELLLAGAAGAAAYWLACRVLCRGTTDELLALAGVRTKQGQ
ncbi:lipopolysaccharide biosynthesis protein [Ferrigenium sp. UT4]